MPLKPGSAYFGLFTIQSPSTLAAVDADELPTATMMQNGSDDLDVVLVVTKIDTGRYMVSGIIPSDYSNDDIVHVWASAIVETIAAKGVISRDVLGVASLDNQVTMLSDLTTIQSAVMGMVAGGQTLTFQSLVRAGGLMTVIPGDSYYTVDGREAVWTSGGAWPDLTGATGYLTVYGPAPTMVQMLRVPISIAVPSGSGQAVSAQLTTMDTAGFRVGDVLSYAISITLSNGHPFTPIVGTNQFVVSVGSGNPP